MKLYNDIQLFGCLNVELDIAAPLCFVFGWNIRTRVFAIGIPFVILSVSY